MVGDPTGPLVTSGAMVVGMAESPPALEVEGLTDPIPASKGSTDVGESTAPTQMEVSESLPTGTGTAPFRWCGYRPRMVWPLS